MKSTDREIRTALHKGTLSELKKKFTETKIIEELGLCQGDVRIDIVAVNGYLHGFEIKSGSDDLRRLPTQIKYYNKILDTITIVIGKKHFSKIKEIIPEWWGIIVAKKKLPNKRILLLQERNWKLNKEIDAKLLVQLLWKDEVIDILKENNLYKGISNKPRRLLWNILANEISITSLRFYVRSRLQSRKNWRVR